VTDQVKRDGQITTMKVKEFQWAGAEERMGNGQMPGGNAGLDRPGLASRVGPPWMRRGLNSPVQPGC